MTYLTVGHVPLQICTECWPPKIYEGSIEPPSSNKKPSYAILLPDASHARTQTTFNLSCVAQEPASVPKVKLTKFCKTVKTKKYGYGYSMLVLKVPRLWRAGRHST